MGDGRLAAYRDGLKQPIFCLPVDRCARRRHLAIMARMADRLPSSAPGSQAAAKVDSGLSQSNLATPQLRGQLEAAVATEWAAAMARTPDLPEAIPLGQLSPSGPYPGALMNACVRRTLALPHRPPTSGIVSRPAVHADLPSTTAKASDRMAYDFHPIRPAANQERVRRRLANLKSSNATRS